MRLAPIPGEPAIRVLVADNTRIHTQLLADALRRDRRLEVVGSVSHGDDLLSAAGSQKIDVAVIGSNLDDDPGRGLELLRQLHGLRPELRIIVLLDSSRREVVLEAFRTGARGLFSRHESPETLSKCVRRVYEGQVWASSEQLGFAVEALAASPAARTAASTRLQSLSKRELDVVGCIVEGLTNREIAERLHLSQHTIKNYLFRVFEKLGVSSRLELMSVALERGASAQVGGEGLGGVDPSSPLMNFADCKRAAERGSTSAQAALALMYSQGNGVEQDLVSAYAWYLLAERNSRQRAETITAARQRLADSLTPEQILEGQKRAVEYFSASQPEPGIESEVRAAAGFGR
ncbi:MAG TPA: LuxR C-terminal-related transcriptional regulator [Terriglobales bacterium]|nr:LuxR C-terminal-related transcriptional regulator [Terriglobales bacterium]